MKVWVSPTSVKAYLGTRVTFICEVDVDRGYQIEWKFYNQPLQPNVIARHNVDLVINSVTLDNIGKYFCIAHSDNKVVTAYGILDILGKYVSDCLI